MSETKAQGEPTMEEILASIRRIISEDEPGPEQAAKPAGQAGAPGEPEPDLEPEREPEPEPEREPKPEPEPEPEPAPDDDEVLDLTQKVNDDGSVVDLAAEQEADLAAQPEADEEPESPRATGPLEAEKESLLDPKIQASTAGALSQLVEAASAQRGARAVQVGDGRTLEEIVREALTPELKAWLDAHLAALVEQIVREEIKKMVRRAEEE